MSVSVVSAGFDSTTSVGTSSMNYHHQQLQDPVVVDEGAVLVEASTRQRDDTSKLQMDSCTSHNQEALKDMLLQSRDNARHQRRLESSSSRSPAADDGRTYDDESSYPTMFGDSCCASFSIKHDHYRPVTLEGREEDGYSSYEEESEEEDVSFAERGGDDFLSAFGGEDASMDAREVFGNQRPSVNGCFAEYSTTKQKKGSSIPAIIVAPGPSSEAETADGDEEEGYSSYEEVIEDEEEVSFAERGGEDLLSIFGGDDASADAREVFGDQSPHLQKVHNRTTMPKQKVGGSIPAVVAAPGSSSKSKSLGRNAKVGYSSYEQDLEDEEEVSFAERGGDDLLSIFGEDDASMDAQEVFGDYIPPRPKKKSTKNRAPRPSSQMEAKDGDSTEGDYSSHGGLGDDDDEEDFAERGGDDFLSLFGGDDASVDAREVFGDYKPRRIKKRGKKKKNKKEKHSNPLIMVSARPSSQGKPMSSWQQARLSPSRPSRSVSCKATFSNDDPLSNDLRSEIQRVTRANRISQLKRKTSGNFPSFAIESRKNDADKNKDPNSCDLKPLPPTRQRSLQSQSR